MPRKRRNPTGYSEEAQRAYAAFHGLDEPHRVTEITLPELPKEAIVLGELISVVYRTPSWSKREHADFEHAFGDTGDESEHEIQVKAKPLLAMDPNGNELYIIHGRSRFKTNERGIVG